MINEVITLFIIAMGAATGAGILTLILMKNNTATVKKIKSLCDDERRGLSNKIEALTNDLEDARRQISILMVIIEAIGNISALDLYSAVGFDSALIHNLATLFSMDELATLAIGVGLNPEDIQGGTVSAKALSLYLAAKHRDLIGKLREAIKTERPLARI